MIKKILPIILVLPLIFSASYVWAAPNFSNADLTTKGKQKILFLPLTTEDSPVIPLGTALDPKEKKLVEGFAIIHYKDKNKQAKFGNKAKGPKSTQCYGYLASGAKWKSVEPWVVNATNSRGLTGDFVFNNLGGDIAKWEDATDGVVGNTSGVDVLGNGSLTSDTLVADTASPDGQNEVYFADIASSGAIAVTIVWGIFKGPSASRQLVEWDQVYDDVDFDWSASGEANKMDLENIATHELGHSVEMDDLYNSVCSEETMYGFANYGETKKRDLNSGDITGVNALY